MQSRTPNPEEPYITRREILARIGAVAAPLVLGTFLTLAAAFALSGAKAAASLELSETPTPPPETGLHSEKLAPVRPLVLTADLEPRGASAENARDELASLWSLTPYAAMLAFLPIPFWPAFLLWARRQWNVYTRQKRFVLIASNTPRQIAVRVIVMGRPRVFRIGPGETRELHNPNDRSLRPYVKRGLVRVVSDYRC